MPQPGGFRYVRLEGLELSPRRFGGREPRVGDVLNLIGAGHVKVIENTLVSVRLIDGVHWLSAETYNRARGVLATSSYEAHEGATLTSARGAWIIVGEPAPVEPPVGAPRGERYVRVETELSRSLGLEPFIVEERFVFRGFKGEDVGVGRVRRYRYFLAAYRRDGSPLAREELERTLLWSNYIARIAGTLGGVSEFMRRELWHIERLSGRSVTQYKVVWRDVAREFIPAVETTGAIPDYTVNYVPVGDLGEACYLLAVLLAPQVNAVVRELSPWIGHVQPRFIKYFKIPRYDPRDGTHKRLAEIGRAVHGRGEATREELKEVEELVNRL
ncbi:MAG: hypothetical protein LM558_02050 [Thermosphaera sp.]|nr:hypothetical protein [Thermosphaera sp.]